jgi:glucans biosynthesis protein C
MASNTYRRRYELDWLRVLAILTVFVYHSTRFFNLGDWHVKNIDTYVWVEMWNVWVTRWMMPLFFIISGASLFYAIHKAGGFSKFYANKFLRLMVPVLVASVTLSAMQVYLERLNHGLFSGSFLSFLPHYFTGVYIGIGMPGNFAFHGMHLWYLLFLFLYSMLCYGLFVWLKGNGQEVLNRITNLFAMPGLIYLWFAIPLVLMKAVIPHPVLSVGNGGWGFLYYIWFLIAGFIIVSSHRLQQCIINQRRVSLLLGLVLSVAYIYQLFGPSSSVSPALIYDWTNALLSFFSAISWVFAILGFGMRYLAFDRPLLRQANEGVLPFFILHQSVLVFIGYFITAWAIPDILKWILIFASSFIAVIAIYTLLIRNFDILRILFGMKTTQPFYNLFRKRSALIVLHFSYIGLIVLAVVSPFAIGGSRSPVTLTYDPGQDIVLNSESITDQSSAGVRVVEDLEASIGKAIEFVSGANERAQSQPKVYIEMRFTAPAGRYIVWLRGKTDINSGYTDSVWLQVDGHIGTRARSLRLGNWLDVHPVGAYGWASDTDNPVAIQLKYTGEHRIRIQPRQTPHRIDQIWLSRLQHRIPDTLTPIDLQ